MWRFFCCMRVLYHRVMVSRYSWGSSEHHRCHSRVRSGQLLTPVESPFPHFLKQALDSDCEGSQETQWVILAADNKGDPMLSEMNQHSEDVWVQVSFGEKTFIERQAVIFMGGCAERYAQWCCHLVLSACCMVRQVVFHIVCSFT